MNNIENVRNKLFKDLVSDYDQSLNRQILLIALIYIVMSIVWNFVFQWYNLPYSRADLSILLSILIVGMGIVLLFRFAHFHTRTNTHIILIFIVYIIVSLYFGSGYSEAWSYFLLIPIINSLYGKRSLLLSYSLIGLISLSTVSFVFPTSIDNMADNIDISNRILLYIIVATFSYLLLAKLNMLYNKQVNTVVESLEKTIEQVVKSFIIAMEAKDQYTFGHSERVSKYAMALAAQLPEFQDPHRMKKLRLSGLLHDIGKIHVSESILTKPGKLTDIEYKEIKTHTVLGTQMIEKVDGLEDLKNGVLYHHERWDGKGYPTGLKGYLIPIEARVLSIADAFDSMTSTRAYRDGLSMEDALCEIEKGFGSQFDPSLKEILEKAKPQFFEIYTAAQDSLDEFEKITDFL